MGYVSVIFSVKKLSTVDHCEDVFPRLSQYDFICHIYCVCGVSPIISLFISEESILF